MNYRSPEYMDKASWIDAFVLEMTSLGSGNSNVPLGRLAENLWPFFGTVDPLRVAAAEHAIWPATFPDTLTD